MTTQKILIIQTAFLGDVILTLPLLQELKIKFPESEIDFLCIPETSELLKGNPFVNEIISYDKKNSGIIGSWELIKKLRNKNYDFLFSPHRSFRSSLISFLSNAKKTVSFDKSSFSFLYNEKIIYKKDIHEIQRNLSLLEITGIKEERIIRPELFISIQDKRKIDSLFYEYKIKNGEKFITIAPGSVWFTKRFPEEKFVKLCDLLQILNTKIFLTGGKKDKFISDFIQNNSKNRNIINVTGTFSILESAELIKRSEVLITNDSAPLHISNAVETNVVAIFGATVPEFGFYPTGRNDIVIQTNGLSCRPCSIHGGKKCPIGTFVCMKNIKEEEIVSAVKKLLS
ncbi:MAG TPA: lipopolysaccharide heptosyltransferase II [Ignavibacteria bacterium]|nr:lipopolysaccharide heptosyltransferase II [Ignavibacteria bacterium]